MSHGSLLSSLVAGVVASSILAACSGQAPDSEPAQQAAATASEAADGHAHSHGGGSGPRISFPVGDGTESSRAGYTLTDAKLPNRAGEAGQLSFTIENYRHRPVRRYLVEQAKRMHVYVVRDDLAVFRHVHPEQQPDGTWVGNLTLPEPGDYRVVAEFVAEDSGGNGDHLVLGHTVTVPGSWEPVTDPVGAQAPAEWVVDATVLGQPVAGPAQLEIRLDRDGDRVQLGQYLGTSAHLTGFHVKTGAVIHMHPLGAPSTGDDGTVLSFHTELPAPGEYVLFLQTRVDEFLHTLPLRIRAT